MVNIVKKFTTSFVLLVKFKACEKSMIVIGKNELLIRLEFLIFSFEKLDKMQLFHVFQVYIT